MDIFSSLAVVLVVAALGGIVAKLLKQPAIIGYILAGIVISFLKTDQGLLVPLGQLGVTLLLFLVGLELPLDELSRMGKTAVITGVGQIVVTAILGFGLCRLLGFSETSAIYLGLGLAFASTVIVINLLSQKRDLQSLYGRLAVGLLLVQDFVAIGVMIILAGVSGGNFQITDIFQTMLKGVLLVGVAVWASTRILPKVLDWFGHSTEILFIVALAWCMGVAALVASPWIGFTVELGGFLAGLTLANAAQNLQLVSRIRPLRDFFVTLFFVSLGATIHLGQLAGFWPTALVLICFVAIVNPIVLMLILGAQGFKKRIAFLTGIAVAQVSEFSLIIMTMAAKAGQIDSQLVSIMALVALATMLISSYLILHAKTLYRLLGPWLPFWFRPGSSALAPHQHQPSEVVLFGHNRVGRILRPLLEKLGNSILVVDFDPAILSQLASQGINAVYGDISDYELYEELNLASSRLVISTVSDIIDNLQLLAFLKGLKGHRPGIIVLAQDNIDAAKLYKSGADYVLVPHAIGGEFLADIIEKVGLDRKKLAENGDVQRRKLAV